MLSNCYVFSIVVGVGDRVMNKIGKKKFCFYGVYNLVGEKQILNNIKN